MEGAMLLSTAAKLPLVCDRSVMCWNHALFTLLVRNGGSCTCELRLDRRRHLSVRA